jgi:hypothetical protein
MWPSSFLCVSTGTGYAYGGAATFENVGIHTETDHTRETQQCDTWGSNTRPDDLITGQKDGLHWAWGSNKGAGDNPKIFYNY